MSKNLYIVPHDFTDVGDAALQYALFLGTHVNVDIRLVHIVNKQSEQAAALKKLQEIISRTDTKGIPVEPLVKTGSIFEDIGKIAREAKAQLIIMGTHGVRGMQKIFGSHAMKVVTSTDVPFLVVQSNLELHKVKRILVPIDLTKESLQIVNYAGDLSHIFHGEVHVIGEKQNDEILSQQLKNRILLVKNQYEERNVNVQVEMVKGGGSYYKKIMRYCKEHEIDFIAIAYHSESLLPQFDNFAQSLITNEMNLPCMVLNSKLASSLYF